MDLDVSLGSDGLYVSRMVGHFWGRVAPRFLSFALIPFCSLPAPLLGFLCAFTPTSRGCLAAVCAVVGEIEVSWLI